MERSDTSLPAEFHPEERSDEGSRLILEAVGLRKSYRQGQRELEVLQGLDLAVKEGEMVAITGPSGAGKSTLLHLLGGLDRPDGGRIRFEGKDLADLPDPELAALRNRGFGFVFQFYHLVPELTALENVALPVRIGNRQPAAQAMEQARRLLERVGLGERLSHLPGQLSGGEQQRVALARALANRPRLVFCDEPTGNLDPHTGQEILKLLAELHRQEGTTFVMVTHEPAVRQVAGRVLSLKDGKLWPHHLI